MGKSNAANWAARWTQGVPDRANDPKRKVSDSPSAKKKPQRNPENDSSAERYYELRGE